MNLKHWFFSPENSGQRLARSTGAIVMLISCLVLLGWVLNLPPLKTLFIGGGNMRANAALGLLLSGFSLSLLTRKHGRRTTRIAQGCMILAGAIGLLTLLQYVSGWNFGIDQLLFRDPDPNPPRLAPGRMSIPAAINLSLISAALGLLTVSESPSPRHRLNRIGLNRIRLNRTSIAQSLALVVGVIALQSLLARCFELPFSSWFGSAKTTMGGHTALTFGLLATGVLALTSDRGWMQILLGDSIGSIAARRFLPGLVLTPLILGWSVFQGHQADWYDANFAMSLMSVVFAVTTVGVVVQGTGWLNQVDYNRKRSSDRLRSTEERLQLAQIATNTGTWEWNPQTGEAFWTETCYLLFGIPAASDFASIWISRIHSEDLPSVQAEMQRCTTTGRIEVEYRYDHPERGLRWIYSRAASASDNPAVMRGISFDITDRKQDELERALAQDTIQRQLLTRR